MKAKDLIKILQEDPERIIVLSSDSEGNSFDEAREVSTSKYDPEEREIGLEKLTAEHCAAGYSREDVMKGGKKAWVIWP